MFKSMCRICLVENIQMHKIVNTELHDTYERLTGYKFIQEARPLVACYICYVRLKRCQQLKAQCYQSEELLIQMINGKQVGNGLRAALSNFNSLSATSVVYTNIIEDCAANVKEEAEDIDIESNTDQYSNPDPLEDTTQNNQHESNHTYHVPLQTDTICIVEIKEERVGPEDSNLELLIVEKKKGSTSKPHLDKDQYESDPDYAPSKAKRNLNTSKKTRVQKPKLTIKKRVPVSKKSTPNIKEENNEIITFNKTLQEHIFIKSENRSSSDIGATTSGHPVFKKSKLNIKTEGVEEERNEIIDKKLDAKETVVTEESIDVKLEKNLSNNNCKPTAGSGISQNNNEQFSCPICNFSFKHKNSLKVHIRSHTNDRPFKCDICKSSFSRKNILKSHVLIHSGEKPYSCEVCKSSFSQKGHLKNHSRIHTGERPYRCNLCPKSYRERGPLINHIRTHTGDKPYQCNICQSKFNLNNQLKNHIRTHTGEKPFKCKLCPKRYRERGPLINHIRTHTGEKPYLCNLCPTSFRERGLLINHIRSHTGDRPYKCDICKRSFNIPSHLKTHLRTHTGDKPYQCDICNKSFNIPGHLKRHNLIHTDERPFKCSLCTSSFRERGQLTKHIRTHTGEKPHVCDICGRRFSDRGNLRRHIRIHTGDKLTQYVQNQTQERN